jgi:hypothetical protein
VSALSWTDKSGALNVIVPDAMLSEAHASEADITEDPVEQGANVSDNIRPKPRPLNLELFVSDDVKIAGGVLISEPGRAERVYSQLEQCQADGSLLSVDLGGVHSFSRSYSNMAVQAVRTTRTAKSMNALTISLVLKEIRIVSSEIVAAQTAKEPKGQPKINGGDKATKPATDDRYESNLHKMFF